MFVQVIHGPVADAAEVRAAMDRWRQDLAPGAVGWLGSTTGVTDDGQLVALARFESADAARRNAERPEQDAWWAATAKLFTGEVTFHDSTDVLAETAGDPDTAGFVQVFSGRASDPDRAWALFQRRSEDWRVFRPEILGRVVVRHGDGYTAALYFSDEESAREGERKEPPPEIAETMTELNELTVGERVFWDLRQPWLASP